MVPSDELEIDDDATTQLRLNAADCRVIPKQKSIALFDIEKTSNLSTNEIESELLLPPSIQFRTKLLYTSIRYSVFPKVLHPYMRIGNYLCHQNERNTMFLCFLPAVWLDKYHSPWTEID